MLLAQVVDLAQWREGDAFADAAANHITALGLESNHEVDERDRKAVEEILGHMQRRRLWCCVWTRDAIVSGLYRQTPMFHAERPLGIKGSGASRPQRDEAHTEQRTQPRSQQVTKGDKGEGQVEGSSELNGEMGLSFSILALMQVGALSRFMAKHIDNVPSSVEAGAPRHPDLHRTPDLPYVGEVRKLTMACHALWKSIDSLLLFFDQCSLKARKNMDNLQPFQPLGWIATIKIAGAMLDLATFRNLAERVEKASRAMGEGMRPEMQETVDVNSLQALLIESQRRTLTSCRRIVKLVEFLLAKDVFQTGGTVLRQLLPVTHFLARMPVTARQEHDSPHSHLLHHDGADLFAALRQDVVSTHSPNQAIDPKALFATPAGHQDVAQVSTCDDPRVAHIPAHIFTSQLEPFDAVRKRREVDVCLEALAQLGYSWPTMDVEIRTIEEIMVAQEMGLP